MVWKLFDMAIGAIQAFIFALLTILYFDTAMAPDEAHQKSGARHQRLISTTTPHKGEVPMADTSMADAVKMAGAMVGAGLALGGGAVGASVGDGLAGSQTIAGIARQPEAQGRLTTIMFLTVGLCEAAYFINLVFAALFVFSLGK